MLHVDIVDSHFDKFYFTWRGSNMLSKLCKENERNHRFLLDTERHFKNPAYIYTCKYRMQPPSPSPLIKSMWSLLVRIIFFSWISNCDFVKKNFLFSLNTYSCSCFCWSVFRITHYFGFLHLDQLEFPPRSPESRILSLIKIPFGFTLMRF